MPDLGLEAFMQLSDVLLQQLHVVIHHKMHCPQLLKLCPSNDLLLHAVSSLPFSSPSILRRRGIM
jgi:hypothetical protein